jgi:hypothetical protein
MKYKIDKSLIEEEMKYQISLLQSYIKYHIKDIHFSPIYPIALSIKNSMRGIYYIVHIPTNNVMYIGQGKINERRIQHKRIFDNGGEKITYVSGKGMVSTVDSPAGRKMRDYDRNLDNWGICYVDMDVQSLKPIEDRLINIYNPPFNRVSIPKIRTIRANNPFW